MQTTATPSIAGMMVATCSGSEINASAPAAWMFGARARLRVVPRATWPRQVSARASSLPRQPQPIIRQRARRSGPFKVAGARLTALAEPPMNLLPGALGPQQPGDRAGDRGHAPAATTPRWRRMDLGLAEEQRLIREPDAQSEKLIIGLR